MDKFGKIYFLIVNIGTVLPPTFQYLDMFHQDVNVYPVCIHLADAGTPAAPFPANRLSTVVQYLRWPNLSSPFTWLVDYNKVVQSHTVFFCPPVSKF